jgi:enterochelin esterase-like enzyme
VTWRIGAGLALALLSAGALNWSYFVQHGAASVLPPLTLRKPLRSLATLFGNRRWLLGFFTGIGGWALYVAALALAPLSLVQASSAGGLGVLAALTGVRSRRERLAVGIAIAGLALLGLSLAGSQEAAGHVSLVAAAVWMVASVALAGLTAGAAANVIARGAGLGIAAGVLYAAGDVGTKAAVTGGFHVAFVPALLACHGLAFVALQLGFQRGSALTTAGLATLWTNALPIAAGMTVFGEPLPRGLLGVARVAAFASVVAGAALLARAEDEPARTADAAGASARGLKIAGGVIAVVAALTFAATALAASSSSHDTSPLPGFNPIDQGSGGGTVWSGRILNPFVPSDARASDVYLPPHYSGTERYPVLYLLHGFWGAPSSFVVSLKLADVADSLIQRGVARPFIAVMPPGGLPAGTKKQRAMSEWAGVWESFVVRTVVPWTDSHLSTVRGPTGRAIAGVSAGGYGAVDIAIRHLGVFSRAESWEGYFRPFRDGPFSNASAATLAAHDPTVLVHEHAAAIRARALRFFLSTGGSHGAVKRRWTLEFAHELEAVHISARLWLQPLGEKGFARHQLPAALTWAEAPTH